VWGRRQTIALKALHEHVAFIRLMGEAGGQDLRDAADALKSNIFYQDGLRKLCVDVCKSQP
jgi:hypothetical protein